MHQAIISCIDYTIIEDPFYDEDGDEIEPICKLETVEFVNLRIGMLIHMNY
ncbi:hypothetical protein YSY43_38820 [Paenibacillus sp. YSY-4.3]